MADELQLGSPVAAPGADFIVKNKGLRVRKRWHREPKACWLVIVTETVKMYLRFFPEIGFVSMEGGGDEWRSSDFL